MESDRKLIDMLAHGKAVFVGDTHGDLEASKGIIDKYLKPDYKIVFLGDYVDRGDNSKENIDYLLKSREENPDQIYLLMGNHDAYGILPGYPDDFWESLSYDKKQDYFEIFGKFPLVVSVGNIIALHGALPDIETLEDTEKIRERDSNWMQILWGDFFEVEWRDLGKNQRTGRPEFGRDYFNELMERFDKKVLIRGHQSNAPEEMYNKKCLTIFTSSAYPRRRIVAIADLEKSIKTVDDLMIEEI